jgi:hypothetical protein
MRVRSHTTWAYSITLLCVLAPALSFGLPPVPRPAQTPTPPSRGEERAVPIPELARWKTQMVSYGQKACLQYASLATDDERLGATYYDAIRVYEQIADYTGNAVWDDCASKAKAIYRGYVLRNNGSVPGYWNFTTGFRMDWERNSDALSKQAAILLSQHAAYCADTAPLDWSAGTNRSREVAYCIMSYLDAEDLGAPRRPRLTSLTDQALGHLDQWFVSKTSRLPDPFPLVPQAAGQYYVQPFMVGLTMQALIRHWEVTHDPRVPPAVRKALDWLWARAWVATDRAFWYENWAPDGNQAFPQKKGAADLNLLIAPAFAWMYHQTGDVAYRDRGDKVFAGGVTRAYLDYGKQFNQNYMWSFDYVKWRSQ